ncbi:MAG: hypothetical protein EOO52_07495 [Gammaproteobacteria bacterium]|nr:MAG: hypothetical protein EOO52_07495 [Gammaproteobacteria bacterium]
MNLKLLKIIFVSALLSLLTSTAYAQARVSYTASIAQRGSTVLIPYATVVSLCADGDGCEIRMGMYNWDGSVAQHQEGRYSTITPVPMRGVQKPVTRLALLAML